MLRCVISGRILGGGIVDRSKNNKPNLSFVDIYIPDDGDTHRVFSVPDNLVNSVFGAEVILSVIVYPGDREYIKFVSEVE